MAAVPNLSLAHEAADQSTMTLSIHTTVTDPEQRQYPWREAIASYCDLADEVIVIDGSKSDDVSRWCLEFETENNIELGKIRVMKLPWPERYTQKEFPIHLNAGLNACTMDWALKMDIDHIIHEKSITRWRQTLDMNADKDFLTFGKLTVIDRFSATLKSKLPFLLNRKLRPEVQYGIDSAEVYNDWSWPVIPNGYYQGDQRIPIGTALEEDASRYIRQEIWNYDYFFRTKGVSKYLFARAAEGYWKQTGKALWGATDEQAWQVFINQSEARKAKDKRPITVEDHPKYIRERVRNLRPDQFGHSHWNNNYA